MCDHFNFKRIAFFLFKMIYLFNAIKSYDWYVLGPSFLLIFVQKYTNSQTHSLQLFFFFLENYLVLGKNVC